MPNPRLRDVAGAVALMIAALTAGPLALANGPATAPSPAAEVEDDADAWLLKLEQAADNIETLHARVRYDVVQGLLGDRQTRMGRLVYARADRPDPQAAASSHAGASHDPAREPPPRFFLRFAAQRFQGRGWEKIDQAFIFDGRRLAERVIPTGQTTDEGGDEAERSFTRRVLADPEQNLDELFELGEGPIPLPVGIRADRVRAKYRVAMLTDRPEQAGDDRSVGLRLSIRPERAADARYHRIDLWIDPSLDPAVPTYIEAEKDPEAGEVAVVDLTALEINRPLPKPDEHTPAGGWFDTTPPQGESWRIRDDVESANPAAAATTTQ